MRQMALQSHQSEPTVRPNDPCAEENNMLDLLMLALGAGFFLAGIGYAYVCDRL